jgi:hypothetical protein
MTPLKSSSGSACCSRCSCGGSSGCGCGCGGASASTSSSSGCGCGCKSTKPKRPAAPPQCEPTVLCEGYTFEVCKMPPQNPRQVDLGALLDRLVCCGKLLVDHIVAIPADHSIPSLKNWCCSLRESLAELFASHPGHSCTIAELIGSMCGNPDQNTNPAVYLNQVLTVAVKIMQQFLLDCFCSAFLPPCPGPVNDDRIFLATITVQKKDCKILEICNWDVRRFVITFPVLSYWLSWLPLGKLIKAAIARICCRTIKVDIPAGAFDDLDPKLADQFRRAQPPGNVDDYSSDLAAIFRNAFRDLHREIDTSTIAMAGFGAANLDGRPLLTPEEMANPGLSVLMHQVARPLIESLMNSFGGTLGDVVGGEGNNSGLERELSDLRATVAAQQESIDALKARLDNQ